MKKCFIIFILLFLITSEKIFSESENYAVLISAGKAGEDYNNIESEYWYDLFLAYEDLIIKRGFSPDNVFVLYGDGIDFESEVPRFQPSLHGWESIVDYEILRENLELLFETLNNIITEDDNLLIRWVVGHGCLWDGCPAGPVPPELTPDTYHVLIDRKPKDPTIDWISIQDLINIFDQIENYKRRKIIWMTCHSGSIIEGNLTFNNDKTTIITSSEWDEWSYSYSIENYPFAQFNYVITSSLFGEDAFGTPYDADTNDDNIISLWELYYEASISPIMSSIAQIGDDCPLAERIYIEEDVVFSDVNLYGEREYQLNNIETQDEVIIPENADVTFAANKRIVLKHGFHAKEGSRFHAFIGDLPCEGGGGTKMLLTDNNTPPYFTNGTGQEHAEDETPDKEQPETEYNYDFSAFPNPFDNSTTIKFSHNKPSQVKIHITNSFGQKVLLLHNQYTAPGNYEINLDGNALQPGVYFCVMETERSREVMKIVKK